MSTTHGHEGADGGEPGRDDLADLLVAGLERDIDRPVDTARLLEGARSGASRIRRRRAVTSAAVTIVAVVALPLAALQLRGLERGGFARTSSASLGAQGSASLATSPHPSGTVSASPTLGHVTVPASALVTGADLGVAGLVAVGEALQKDHTPTTGRVVCSGQPGGLQYTLGGAFAEYDQGNLTRDGWMLTAAARALTPDGARAEMRYLVDHLDTCDSKVGAHWSRQPAPTFGGDSSAVLAYAPDDITTGSYAVVGVVRLGGATSGFWLHVPASAGPNPSARLTTALRSGRILLEAADRRLRAPGPSVQRAGVDLPWWQTLRR